MARASAKSKAAGFASSLTSTGPGITTHEISQLRDMFLASPTTSPTSPFQTRVSWQPSQPPSRQFEFGPNSSRETVITIQMPDDNVIQIQTKEVSIEFERDFTDVTTRRSPVKTYLVDRGTFTIKGKM